MSPGRLHTCILGDVDGDYYPDLISYATNDVFSTYPVERLAAWDRNGEMLDGWPLTTKPAGTSCVNFGSHIPAVGDINKDGNADLITTTGNNELVFQNFKNTPYYASNVPVPFWRYNRRINSVAPIHVAACGDTNDDQAVNVSDAVYIINYVFAGGAAPYPYESGDTNCDYSVNISDAVWIINYIFVGGKSPCDTDGDGLPDC
jgi:hypothetical protein